MPRRLYLGSDSTSCYRLAGVGGYVLFAFLSLAAADSTDQLARANPASPFGTASPSFQGVTSRPLTISSDGGPGFQLMAPATTGLVFTNALPERRHLTNQIMLNGSGVAAGDIDGEAGVGRSFKCQSMIPG